MDGDAEILPGSIDALVSDLAAQPGANAAAGMPANGRSAAAYRRSLREERGLFGDLYALSGRFVAAIRMKGLRLPEDLIGDDRSEERRVGKACVSTCRSRWSPSH